MSYARTMILVAIMALILLFFTMSLLSKDSIWVIVATTIFLIFCITFGIGLDDRDGY